MARDALDPLRYPLPPGYQITYRVLRQVPSSNWLAFDFDFLFAWYLVASPTPLSKLSTVYPSEFASASLLLRPMSSMASFPSVMASTNANGAM